MTEYTELTLSQARKVAKSYGIRLPRVGYEVATGDGLWLASTGHFQFGWFASKAKTPYTLRGTKFENRVRY